VSQEEFIMPLTNFPNGITSFGVPIFGGFGGPIGIGMGDLRYVVAAKASSNLYYKHLMDIGVANGDIYSTLAAAYAATTSGQNDVIAVTPGTYTVTASLEWANSNTHLIGLGGPVYDGSDQYACNILFECTTINVAEVLKVSGNWNQFYNVGFANRAADADNLAAVNVTSYGNYFETVGMYGLMAATQDATVAAASLYVGDAGLSKFVNCIIGSDVWTHRSGAKQAQIRFTGTGRPNNITFKGCQIKSNSNTADCVMVAMPAVTSIGRNIVFDDCLFSNWYDSGTELTAAFYDVASSSQKNCIALHRCSAFGIAEWTTLDSGIIMSTMPVASTAGGHWVEPTT
jgi:hypothetical protein